jgi:nitrite reductase/ring-hydroxylating ferredoxin subunit
LERNQQSAVSNQKSAIARRDFLALLGRGALWATAGVTVVALLRYLSFVEPIPPQIYVLETPDAYPVGTLTSVAEGRAFVGHDDGGLYAINATCTHLGCLVKQSAAGFDCPCHGSQFTANGDVTHGPATASLTYSALSLDSEGKVILELNKSVAESARLAV